MNTYPINNTEASETVTNLLQDDINYLLEYNRFYWGDYSDNLANKIGQYEELPTVPVFDTLLTNGFYIATAFLEYIRPECMKSILHVSPVLQVQVSTTIIIPLHVPISTAPVYQSYHQELLSQYQDIKDSSLVVATIQENKNLIDEECDIQSGIPLIINSTRAWAGIYNKNSTDHYVGLRMTLSGNPSFESVVSAFTG